MAYRMLAFFFYLTLYISALTIIGAIVYLAGR